MGDYAKANGMRHRSHGKMHKSVDVQKLAGEALVGRASAARRSARRKSSCAAASRTCWCRNSVRDLAKIDRLACLPKFARASSSASMTLYIADLFAAAEYGTQLEIFVIDCGAGRCGVTSTDAVVKIAQAADAAPGLKFTGIQAYQGAMQHIDSYEAWAMEA